MDVAVIENIGESLGLTIKIQLREALGFNFFRIVVATQEKSSVKIWGELKGWTIPLLNGLNLDTMRVVKQSPPYVSELIWATTMAWAIERTSCRYARLLAIYDDEGYSKKLVRYFRLLGFNVVKEVGSSPADLLLRLIWGGAGTLMKGDCSKILDRLIKKLKN
tara:strand:+ start:72 stop:560 length:489 start_codon:yes stop_codon:yes gene_type:complete